MVTMGRCRKLRRPFRNFLRRSLRFSNYLFGKLMRQMVLPDNDFHVDADISRASQNFEHASGGRQAALGKTRDFDVHYGAIQFRKTGAAADDWLSSR